MTARSRFVEALKRAVHARGMTYAALGGALRLSEASVKRMFSRGTFTLARIEQILGVLELDLAEIARMTRQVSGALLTFRFYADKILPCFSFDGSEKYARQAGQEQAQ
jgi:transcriptional regulator with XRE-family HTH domain